jgi:hypothetical protein
MEMQVNYYWATLHLKKNEFYHTTGPRGLPIAQYLVKNYMAYAMTLCV